MCLEQQISILMISEGSCDTEDWSNDAENTDLITGINYIWTYIQIETLILSCNNRRDFSKTLTLNKKTLNLIDPKLFNGFV